MKKYKIFLILIISFIALQLSVEGLSFSLEQAEIAERCLQLREFESYRPIAQRVKTQKTDLICSLLAIICLSEYRLPGFVFIVHKKCSVSVSELFNNSPPLFLANA